MARIFITGSSDGLGLGAARRLMDEGHEVVLHARSAARAREIGAEAERAHAVLTGDLSRRDETLALADQVNAIGDLDAIIHNAGIYREQSRADTPDGHAKVLAVNVLAPYVLTAKIVRPKRLIYISSGLHRGHAGVLEDIDWTRRRWDADAAYGESKMLVTTLSAAVARHWSDVFVNAVDPGWVPTKMGGPSASDDLEEGHLTQTWLAVSEDAAARISGGYWHHLRQQSPERQANDPSLQDKVVARLGELTGVTMF